MVDSSRRTRGEDVPERLRIVQVTSFYPPYNFGGDGVQVQRLSAALSRRGHDVTVVHTPVASELIGGRYEPPPAPPARADGPREIALTGGLAKVEPFLVHQLGVPVLQRHALRRALGGEGAAPDVIHYHNLSLLGGVGALGLGSGVKFLTPHEYWLVCPTHQLLRFGSEPCTRPTCLRCVLHARQPPQWWRYTGLRDRALDNVDRMVFPSELTRAALRDRGVSRPSAVLHHFLPDAYIEGAASVGPRREAADPYFLYVGRLDAEKGIGSLVEQFSREQMPAPLLVAGTGPLRDGLDGQPAGRSGVHFLGRVEGRELSVLYRDAIAVILPSVAYEVFGLVVPEALAHGTPVIVSTRAGAREVVDAAGGGLVYESPAELAAALRALASDPARRAQLGARGREYVGSELSEVRYVERYEALIREVRAA